MVDGHLPILEPDLVHVPDERLVGADVHPEATLCIVVLQACVEFKHFAILEYMDGEALRAPSLGGGEAGIIIVKFDVKGRGIRHVNWVIVERLQELLQIPLLSIMRRVHHILQIIRGLRLVQVLGHSIFDCLYGLSEFLGYP